MNETPMLFPMEPQAFWKQMKDLIGEVINEKLTPPSPKETDLIPKKPLLKLSEVCLIFQVTKPTVYDWMKQKKLDSFKIRSRRYFAREDIEALIKNK